MGENGIEQGFLFDEHSRPLRVFRFAPGFRTFADERLYAGKVKRLYLGGEQGAWFDLRDPSLLYQDRAGTVPFTEAGDPVRLALDKTGNGNHAEAVLLALLAGSDALVAPPGTLLAQEELRVAMPNLGGSVTIGTATTNAIHVLTGQTVAAGPYALPSLRGLVAHVVIDRPLSGSETNQLTQYLEFKASIAT